jgi:hypothetical protein
MVHRIRPSQHQRIDVIDLHDIQKVSTHSSLSDANAETQPHTFLSHDHDASSLLLLGRADSGIARQSQGQPTIEEGRTEARGWMSKRGEYNPAFQSRYFVLSRGVLSWFRPEQVSPRPVASAIIAGVALEL